MEKKEAQLRQLLTVFLMENQKLNLSALRTEDACWHRNILDSLAFLALIDQEIIPTPRSIIDVGTGGGFPLLPLAITLPLTTCMGLDSTGKKIEAIRRISQQLELPNVELATELAEVAGHDPRFRERFDAVLSRAVAPLSTLLEFTVPLAAVNGHIVLWKSMHIDEELQQSETAQKKLHCELARSYQYHLGEDRGIRQLLVFHKKSATPPAYPREVGVPKKEPI